MPPGKRTEYTWLTLDEWLSDPDKVNEAFKRMVVYARAYPRPDKIEPIVKELKSVMGTMERSTMPRNAPLYRRVRQMHFVMRNRLNSARHLEQRTTAQSTCQFCGAHITASQPHKGWCPVILPPGEIDKL